MSINSPFGYCQEYYRYLGNYPEDANPGWHEDVQGVTHDDDYWFITQSDTGEADEQVLWKIPVGHDLRQATGNSEITKREIRSYPQLNGYNHFGDLDYFNYRQRGFLIVGLSGDDMPDALAVFRADTDTLDYVAHTTDFLNSVSSSWVAVDSDGFIYFPDALTKDIPGISVAVMDGIVKYMIDWDQLFESGRLQLTFQSFIILYDENGDRFVINYTQGGVFSRPLGNLFYMVTGLHRNTNRDRHGIHVFDTDTWRRVKKSTNGHGQFNYEFHPGIFGGGEEPEGLTVWDLDDGRAPGIRGQLHVLMLDNDWFSADEIYFKHYTDRPSPTPPKPPLCPRGQKCCETLPTGKGGVECHLCVPMSGRCP